MTTYNLKVNVSSSLSELQRGKYKLYIGQPTDPTTDDVRLVDLTKEGTLEVPLDSVIEADATVLATWTATPGARIEYSMSFKLPTTDGSMIKPIHLSVSA